MCLDRALNPYHQLNEICMNGRHQFDYYLSYLYDYEHTLRTRNIPYMDIFLSNLNHDESALRLQGVDKHLADYINKTVHNSRNSIMILVSDHGNSYSTFENYDKTEFERELYHPMFFMIVPPNVKKQMGKEMYNRLVAAQRKVTNMGDVRRLLKCFLYRKFSHRQCGDLFMPISRSRSCCDLKFHSDETKCICDQVSENKLQNDDLEELFVTTTNEYFTKMVIKLVGTKPEKQLKSPCQNDVKLNLLRNASKLFYSVR